MFKKPEICERYLALSEPCSNKGRFKSLLVDCSHSSSNITAFRVRYPIPEYYLAKEVPIGVAVEKESSIPSALTDPMKKKSGMRKSIKISYGKKRILPRIFSIIRNLKKRTKI